MNPAKRAVQTHWDARPCGSLECSRGSPAEFFRQHARIRYAREPEIETFACFGRWQGERVLEIGVGMGADYVRFAMTGANITGVDLSFRSLQLACQNAQAHRISSRLLNADAESLPFADSSFDLVYSWGVLHHTPDVQRALREVHRVVRPDGECRIMLYNRHSLLALQCYLRYGLTSWTPPARIPQLIAEHIESPGTKAFTLAELRLLFRDFGAVEITPIVTAYDLRFGRRRFAPRWLRRLIPARFGWFVLVRARK